jgi:hypothetical protein
MEKSAPRKAAKKPGKSKANDAKNFIWRFFWFYPAILAYSRLIGLTDQH